MDGQLAAKATELVVEVLIAVLTLASGYVVYYLHLAAAHVKEKTQKMQDQEAASVFWRASQQLEDVTSKVVEKLEQTVVGELRQKVKDGTVDRAELLAIGESAYKEVIKTLGSDVLAVLALNLGDYVTHIKNTIESKVFQLKQVQAGS